MPTVKRFDRCRIEMYFADHSPPHFHVITRSDERAVYLIETLALWAGEADPRDTEGRSLGHLPTGQRCGRGGNNIPRRSHE